MEPEIYFNSADVEKNKGIVLITAILQCLGVGMLFFLPLIACKDSEYGKFYANQGLLLFIGELLAGVISKTFPLAGSLIGRIAMLGIFILAVLNAINAYKGAKKGFPFLGIITIIK